MRQHILISGSTVAKDDILSNELQKSGTIFKTTDNSQVETILASQKVDLLLMEISHTHSEVGIIEDVKKKYPDIKIILINGNGVRDVIAQGFQYGAKDAFRKPYKRDLLVERISALIDL